MSRNVTVRIGVRWSPMKRFRIWTACKLILLANAILPSFKVTVE